MTAGPNYELAAGQLHRSMAHPLQHGEETDACAEHYRERGGPQSVPHSCAHRATAGRHSSSSTELLDQHALPACARPSIYAAKRFCCGPGADKRQPTKQFYTKLSFY